MRLKTGVSYVGVQPQIWYAIGVADELHRMIANSPIVVTSLTDGEHNPGSLHPKGLAADLRDIDLNPDDRLKFFSNVRNRLSPLGFDVVWEGGRGATPYTTGAHIHLEFQPKSGQEAFFSYVA